MSVAIEESGMSFGPYLDENCFHIEKSNIYIKLQNGLPIAEFLLLQPDKNKLLVVEAKSSSPNPGNNESQDNLKNFITEISEKLLNAFSLGLALCLERHLHSTGEIPSSFKSISHDSIQIILLLIIKGHKKEWLTPLNDILQKKLRNASKVWDFKVNVINDEMAKKYNLIQTTRLQLETEEDGIDLIKQFRKEAEERHENND